MSEKSGLPTAERLLSIADTMTGQPVLLMVDLVADRYIYGSPKRVSREAPILILRYEGESYVLGGGANAIANVRALGGEPLPLGVLGADDSGERLRGELERLGVTTEGLISQGSYRTPTKTRLMGGDPSSVRQQIARYDIESTAQIGEAELEHFRNVLDRWYGRASVAVMSDYGYGGVRPELVGEIKEALVEPPCLLCDSRYRLADFAGMHGATPNQEELEEVSGADLDGDEDRLARAGKETRRNLSAEFLLVTRGSNGMSLFEEDTVTHIPVHGTGQVADVTGAGDTVIGTLALAKAAGATALEAAVLANYAAGVVVHKPGTAVPSQSELQRAIRTDPEPIERIRRELA
jgi:rfaE bifunctional protein kinase chain/domain